MAGLTAWEDAGITTDHQPSIRFEWRPNVKDQEPGYEGAPEYLDTGQLLVSKWNHTEKVWDTYMHVAYCHIDAVGELIADMHGKTEFVQVSNE